MYQIINMLPENEEIVKQIKQSYPSLPEYLIDLAISYCKDRTEQEINDMLERTATTDEKEQQNK
jgi:uncharacterized protein (DUF433 family)